MLPYRSLWSNTKFAYEVLELKAGDKIVSMLPMAHMYGLAFEFLYEFSVGGHIYFLTRMPSPKIIFQAFEEVKPNLIVAVPLIIEKIIKKSVLPKLETPTMKILLKVPIINDKIKATIREEMIKAFGGNFAEIIVGGANFQPRGRAIPENDRLPLHRGLRYDRMWADHLLRRLEKIQTGFVRKGCATHGCTGTVFRSREYRRRNRLQRP